MDTSKSSASRIPVHEQIRRDAAAHPGGARTHSERVEAARRIAAPSYREALERISPETWAEIDRELEDDELGL